MTDLVALPAAEVASAAAAVLMSAGTASAPQYGAVDFQSPVTTLWVVGVALVIGVSVLVHAIWRRRRHVAHAERTGRNTDPSFLRDTRVEQVVAYVCFGLAVVLAGFAAAGAWQTHQNVRGNLAEKYGVTAVDNARWSGAFLVADLTMADGTVEEDARVYFEPDGEPLTGEDIFVESPGA